MFTFKFLGLAHEDAETPYYYGSLPGKPFVGQWLHYEETDNYYEIIAIQGKGLTGDSNLDDQQKLAWTEIAQNKSVPTLHVRQLRGPEKAAVVALRRRKKAAPAGRTAVAKLQTFTGQSVEWEDIKRRSQKNRKTRFSKTKPQPRKD
jgi:hypothetical protein